MLLKKLVVNSGDGFLGVENGGEIEWNSYVDEVAAYLPMFLKKSFGLAKSKFWALMSSGSGSRTVEPELILRRP